MRLLVTGATGFIGSSLSLAAREAGHSVLATGLVNTPAEAANAARLRETGIDLRPFDLTELAEKPAHLARCDAVIHLAAAQHEVSVPDQHFEAVNVEGTRALLAACAAAGGRRFVYGSTIGVYGQQEGELDESSPTEPGHVYGRTKLAAEREVLAGSGGPERVVMRISETYGPSDRRLLKLFRGVRAGRLCLIGSGRNLHHPIYVDDLVRGLLLGATHPAAAGEVLVLAGAEVVTTDQMVAAIADAVGAPPPDLRLPLWPFMAVASVLEAACRPLRIQPPLHRRRMDFFRRSFRLDGSKALDRLGFRSTVGFLEGVHRTAAWYRAQGMLGGPAMGPAGQAPRSTSSKVRVTMPAK